MFDVPTSLSPSRVESFTTCPMAFRFSSIERIAEPPAPHLTKGSLVHRALELLYVVPPHDRDRDATESAFDTAWAEYLVHPDLTGLGFDDGQLAAFRADARRLTLGYLQMEDPAKVRAVGLELRLEAEIDELVVRGIIDRLDILDDGSLVVNDYKTGRSPGPAYRQQRLGGVHLYAMMCEQVLGRRPDVVRLLYVGNGDVVEAPVTAQSVRFVTSRTTAVHKAIAQACRTGTFAPRTGPLCASCSFKPWCSAFGGDPDRAAVEAPAAFATDGPTT
jgi:putative RecB family exonuclease